MNPLFLLDFDGVLFDSAYEAYTVCQKVSENNKRYSRKISFDEFMDFRSVLTDAWQYGLLFENDRKYPSLQKVKKMKLDADTQKFSEVFFEARKELMKDDDWVKLMSPYPFFHQIKKYLIKYPDLFKIVSTRNFESIKKTLDFHGVKELEIFGQEDIRLHGSKLAVAEHNKWSQDYYVIYIDDMNSHLEPFEGNINLCIHADWGYDKSSKESYTQLQAFQILESIINLKKDSD